ADRRAGEAMFNASTNLEAVRIAERRVDLSPASADVEAQVVIREDAVLARHTPDINVGVVNGRVGELSGKRRGVEEAGILAANRVGVGSAAAGINVGKANEAAPGAVRITRDEVSGARDQVNVGVVVRGERTIDENSKTAAQVERNAAVDAVRV